MNGIRACLRLRSGGLIDNDTTVHIHNLTGAVPRYARRIGAGTWVFLADLGKGQANIAISVKGCRTENHVRADLGAVNRVCYKRVAWTREGLRPTISLRRAKLDRVVAIQVRIGI